MVTNYYPLRISCKEFVKIMVKRMESDGPFHRSVDNQFVFVIKF